MKHWISSAESGNEVVVDRPADYWRAATAAREYERGRFSGLWGRAYRWREENAIQRALGAVRAGSTVLDAACGTGRVTALLWRKGLRATACDISVAMLTVAREQLRFRGYEIPLVVSDIEQLPYSDESFDVVTCVGLLMHLGPDARVRALRELARITRDSLVVQYGRVQALNRLRLHLTGHPPGKVRYTVSEDEMRMDQERSGLTERRRFWVFRGLSSSVVVALSK